MNDYKLKMNKELERSEMMVNDYQSRLMNDFVQEDDIDRVIQKAQLVDGLLEAKVYIYIRIIQFYRNKLEFW